MAHYLSGVLMKKIRELLILPTVSILCFLIICSLTACSGDLKNNNNIQVTLHIGDGIAQIQEVDKALPLAGQLADAEKIGFTFCGWYENVELTVPLSSTKLAEHVSIVYAAWEMAMLDLPIFNVYLEDAYPLDEVNRAEYVNATMSILNTEEEFLLDDITTEFRGRGNGSWVVPKKSWRLKLTAAASLLGNASNRHWALVANGVENTMMRNTSAYTIAREVLDGIEYTTTCNFVELYVNDEYRGVYSLFEHVRIGVDRVNITTDRNILDTGYLLEYDAYVEDEGGQEGIDWFRIDGLKYPFALKSPDPDDYYGDIERPSGNRYALHPDQVEFIQDYVTKVWKAVRDQDFEKFAELADVESFVDMYILHELYKNTDTGWSSFYVYKKAGGKLYAGPAWDFDFTAGRSRGDYSYEGLYVADTCATLSDYTSSEIYICLMQNENFVKLVKARWQETKYAIIVKVFEIFSMDAVTSEAFARNWELWGSDADVEYLVEIEGLKSWLLCRIVWLSVCWAE